MLYLFLFSSHSESSLFVGRHRFILKTCGTTLLLHAIKPLMDLAMKYCGFEIAVCTCMI